MTSQADFDSFVESQRGVRRLLLRDLAAWWAAHQDARPSDVKREALGYLPALAARYGELSAAAGADFFDAARGDAGVTAKFRSVLPKSGAAEAMARSAVWTVDPVFYGDQAAAFGRMSIAVDAAALQEGRDAVMFNVRRDPARPRWARVPVGKTCAWCLMLASRGARYRSRESAGGAGQYHGGSCDCQPVPSWNNGDDLPPSYDEGALFGLYERARADAGNGHPKAITRALRRLDGGVHVSDGVAP